MRTSLDHGVISIISRATRLFASARFVILTISLVSLVLVTSVAFAETHGASSKNQASNLNAQSSYADTSDAAPMDIPTSKEVTATHVTTFLMWMLVFCAWLGYFVTEKNRRPRQPKKWSGSELAMFAACWWVYGAVLVYAFVKISPLASLSAMFLLGLPALLYDGILWPPADPQVGKVEPNRWTGRRMVKIFVVLAISILVGHAAANEALLIDSGLERGLFAEIMMLVLILSLFVEPCQKYLIANMAARYASVPTKAGDDNPRLRSSLKVLFVISLMLLAGIVASVMTVSSEAARRTSYWRDPPPPGMNY